MKTFKQVLAACLVRANEGEPDIEDVSTLRCLKDERGQKVAEKLYKEYCDEEDMSRRPAFIQDLDKLLWKHRSNKKSKDDKAADNDLDEE